MNLSKVHQSLVGEAQFRHVQAEQAIFRDLVDTWELVTNFPKDLRARLQKDCPLAIEAELMSSADKSTSKALITLEDGLKIETVLISQNDGRQTVCVSSQVGCPLACEFCATGQNGFSRNLLAAEIVEQVLFWQRYLKKEGLNRVDNVVFMGMGEPLLNYEQVIKALKWLNDPETFNLGARRLSVSTVGIPEEIKRLAGEPLQLNLAVSLHFASDLQREHYMPIARKYSLEELMKAVSLYQKKAGRQVMFEYLMIRGINDSDNDAKLLAQLLSGRPLSMVNLIPYNPTGRFLPSTPERVREFKKSLEDLGLKVTKRRSYGGDIAAACGQLAKK
ncbi:MAG: 23S rRNA (adenine(2503)-C(2))-methyltransferase RlmN [Patescibacteria group bacterium]|nr:23S rRNA (adenine(2503)-C(2))-methyltransferase RlmN [Patescibacteria group bacterium]